MEFLRLTQPLSFKLIRPELWELDDNVLIPERITSLLPKALRGPGTIFYAAIDENEVVGFYWAGINAFSNRLQVYALSLDKEHQKTNGENIAMFKDLSRRIVKENNLSDVVELYSNHPKVAERYGLTKARCTIMEFDTKEQEDGQGRGYDSTAAIDPE